MRKATVVIGANFGDEGKGLMTDYLATQADTDHTLIVRFNGGAQAGHSVETPDGRRHIFSHFGSASFLSCPTYLSKHFIVNPMFFGKELEELKLKGVSPFIYIDERCIVSTPFDIFINQLVEKKRGKSRHGSCGLGINETVTRSLRDSKLRLQIKDLTSENSSLERLSRIETDWFETRLNEHEIDMQDEEVQSFIRKKDRIIRRFLQDVLLMLNRSTITKTLPDYCSTIFEGAQGLLLDEGRIDLFPHLTRSRTGLTNVIQIAQEARVPIAELNVVYATRTYLTRHGAGPLKGEESWSFPDSTNVPNEFQGSLRFAPLDFDQLTYAINLDLQHAKNKLNKINASIAITCADQMKAPDRNNLPLPVSHISYGPSRNDVQSKTRKQFVARGCQK
jgi:adenylosuccinate synthase